MLDSGNENDSSYTCYVFSPASGTECNMRLCPVEVQNHLRVGSCSCHRLLMDWFHTVREEHLLRTLPRPVLRHLVQYMFHGVRLPALYDSACVQEISLEAADIS